MQEQQSGMSGKQQDRANQSKPNAGDRAELFDDAMEAASERRIQILDQLLGERIRVARKSVDFSATELAQGVGITVQEVLDYEAGKNQLPACRLALIAAVLDRPIEWFYRAIIQSRDALLFGELDRHPRLFENLHRIMTVGDTTMQSQVAALLTSLAQGIPADLSASTQAAKLAINAVKPRVLLVDDDPDVLAVTSKLLEKAGYIVVVAEDGDAGLSVVSGSDALAAIITDYAMPNMNGAVFLTKAAQLRPNLPALIITGFAEQAQLESVPSGVKIVRKPFMRAELLAWLAGVTPTRADTYSGDSQSGADASP